MANNNKLKTEAVQKDAGAELAELNAAAAEQLASQEAPAAPVAPADPEIEALAEASAQAAANQQAAEVAKAAKKASLNTHINANVTKPSVGESQSLIASVKADAEKRGKAFSVCPISGVLVVG